MVTKYGMSEVLGKVSLNYEDMPQQLSSETRAQVEQEVRVVLGHISMLHVPLTNTISCRSSCRRKHAPRGSRRCYYWGRLHQFLVAQFELQWLSMSMSAGRFCR